MIRFKFLNAILALIILFSVNSCGIYKRSDVKDNPVNVNERVKKNIQEGRGFRFGKGATRGGDFDFASSNSLWRASVEILDFVPLTNASYSGGIIITDWFSSEKQETDNSKELKITVRFLSNEVRSDALDIDIFLKKCSQNLTSCSISKNNNDLASNLNLSILKKAAKYEKDMLAKRRKDNPYPMGQMKQGENRDDN